MRQDRVLSCTSACYSSLLAFFLRPFLWGSIAFLIAHSTFPFNLPCGNLKACPERHLRKAIAAFGKGGREHRRRAQCQFAIRARDKFRLSPELSQASFQEAIVRMQANILCRRETDGGSKKNPSSKVKAYAGMSGLRFHTVLCILLVTGFFPAALIAHPENGSPQAHALLFVQMHLNRPVKFTCLKKGDVLRGVVARNVYSGYHLMIPAGTPVSLRVSGMERRRKEWSDKWPWPAEYFRSKSEKFPTFDLLTASLPAGGNTSFPVSSVTAFNEIHLTAKTLKGGKSGDRSQHASTGENPVKAGNLPPGSTLELVVDAHPQTGRIATTAAAESGNEPPAGIETLAAGTETTLALVDRLSASASRPGDPFKAILAEPLRLSSGEIVPEGSLLEGRVGKSTPPRWLSRPGSLYLTFNRLVLPTGVSIPIAASIVGAEANRNTRMKVDSEGGLSGGSPGKKRLLVGAGVAFGLSKVTDDSFQLIAETLVSTATDASTAGTARLIGMAVGGFFFIRRHGRDVVLPSHTMLNVRFDRPPSLLTPKRKQRGMR